MDTDGVRHCIDQLRVDIDLRRWPAEVHIHGALGDRNKTRVNLPPYDTSGGFIRGSCEIGSGYFLGGEDGMLAAIEQLE